MTPIQSDIIPPDNPYGQHLLRTYDKSTAEAEFQWHLLSCEGDEIRRKERKERDVRRNAMSADLNRYLEKRKIRSKQVGCTYTELWALDAAFLKEQEAREFNVDEWLNEFGDSISKEINRLQNGEKSWIEACRWEAEKKRRLDREEAVKRQAVNDANKGLIEHFVMHFGDDLRDLAKQIMLEVLRRGK